jgi:hypothetical protein
MGEQFTIKMDTRALYALVAVLAVLGIFVIGWWVGRELIGSGAPTEPVEVADAPAQPVTDPGAVAEGAQSQGFQVNPADPDAGPPPGQLERGAAPIPVSEVPAGAEEPRIWIEELSGEDNFTFNLGEIPATKSTEKTFTIRNDGTAALVIQDASASCGCAAAVVEDKQVAPGESTLVRVSYDPRVNNDQGRFVQKQVRIRSNDPYTPLVEFNIAADVSAE